MGLKLQTSAETNGDEYIRVGIVQETSTTMYNVCAVPWGAQYHGSVQYRGGYHDICGDILSTMGVFSTMGDIMSTMGVILSTVGDTQYRDGYHDVCGGYHEYSGGVQYRGEKIFCYLSTPRYS